MWPWVNTMVCAGRASQPWSASWARAVLSGLLVSTTTRPSSVAIALTLENATTSTVSLAGVAISPKWPNHWWPRGSVAPVQIFSDNSKRSVDTGCSLSGLRGSAPGHPQWGRPAPPFGSLLRTIAHENRTCFTFGVTISSSSTPTALARNQAARRRRVLDAAVRLADRGGFDSVQMRDVATEASVALGTVYRY